MHLYQHQTEALERTADKNRCAYYLDMGLGKTFVGSEKMDRLGKLLNLVVCQKSKVPGWVEHFRTHYPCTVYDLTNAKDFKAFVAVAGYPDRYAVGIINYDLVFRRPELMRLKGFTLMLDESSLIQNTSAKRTKSILTMKPDNVILLSGTPTAGRYERLWSQMHLLGWPISKTLYNQTYVVWDYLDVRFTDYRIPVVRGYKNVDRLKQKMAEYGCVFMKTEDAGIDLPKQQDVKVKVPVSKEYKRFMKQRFIRIGDADLVGDTSLTLRLYARQLCGAYSKEKIAALRDLIESTEERLIVFYNFNLELAQFVDLAKELKRPYSVVNGERKDLQAYEESDDSLTFIQYQAGAYGLNLQKANRIIYYTLPESSEMYEQSRKRIHRIGQEKTCFYYLLMCTGSVEDLIYKTLMERKDLTDDLFKAWIKGD